MAKVKKQMKHEIDGKDRISPKSSHKTLQQIWGAITPKYFTNDAEIYKKTLQSMNKADLQKECIRVERMPKDSREAMINFLVKDFELYINTLKTQLMEPKTYKVSDEVRKILALGGNSVV